MTSPPQPWPRRQPGAGHHDDAGARFQLSKGLFKGASSADAVGMAFPGGKTLGDPAHVTLRFDDSFMKLAAAGKL
jgi:hypothetical protein